MPRKDDRGDAPSRRGTERQAVREGSCALRAALAGAHALACASARGEEVVADNGDAPPAFYLAQSLGNDSAWRTAWALVMR
jgi:hypothetical protein